MSVAANLSRIKESIGASPVTLIAVTKNVGLEKIEAAFDHGVTEFGENRVQDALEKQKQLPPRMADKVNWHFIGHLQTNKVKKVVGNFSLIHSVDSYHLAEEVSREAAKRGITQPVLIQVKVVADPSKSGYSVDDVKHDFPRLLQLPNIEIKGLMTMAPLTADQEVWKRCFCGLRQLRDELEQRHGVKLQELSMGMSQDWPDAVACGATMIRVGRAIFGS